MYLLFILFHYFDIRVEEDTTSTGIGKKFSIYKRCRSNRIGATVVLHIPVVERVSHAVLQLY